MRALYRPSINYGVRTLLKPFARFVPESLQFPVHGTITVGLWGGKSVKIACNPTSYLAKVLFWQGARGFEYNQVRLFADLVKEARVFLDIGANIGYYSLVAAAFNPEVRIISFEPLPAAYHYLEKNLALNGCRQATPVDVALSDRTGTARFFAARNPKYLEIEHHLTSTGALDRQQASRSHLVDTYEVQTETLDHYLAQHGIADVDLIKLDTEASEHLVLAGAHTVLSDHRPVILCEVLPGKIERDLEAIFRKYGYAMYRIEADRLVAVEGLAHQRATTNDHVMVHPDAFLHIERYTTS